MPASFPPVLSPAPNILINPFMEIDQANEGSSVSLTSGTSAYVVDGWKAAFHSSSAAVSAQRVADGPLTLPNSVKITVSTGASVGAGDYLYLLQPIEANNVTDLALGTVSALTLSVTFWVKSSIGSYVMSGAIQNGNQTRSYPFNITVSSANTWTQCAVTLPGDTTGSWVTSGTNAGAILALIAAAGSTYQGTVSTWAGSNYLGTSANTNTILSTTGSTFQIAGVKLEASPIPTPYGRRNFEDELARCQRFFEKTYDLGTIAGTASNYAGAEYIPYWGTSAATYIFPSRGYKVTKREAPIVTLYSTTTGVSAKIDNNGAADVTASATQVSTTSFRVTVNSFSPNTGVGGNAMWHWNADCRL